MTLDDVTRKLGQMTGYSRAHFQKAFGPVAGLKAHRAWEATAKAGGDITLSDGTVVWECEVDAVHAALTEAAEEEAWEAAARPARAARAEQQAAGKLADSGAREACGGSTREPEGARGRFDLVPLELVRTVAVHLTKGAEKYAPNAWRSGMPYSRCISSALRHLLQFAAGQTDEDHLAAAICNLTFIATYREDIAAGRLPASLDDRYVPPAPETTASGG